jgi:hypothetical protein
MEFLILLIVDTKFALECHRRLRKLESRFRRAKMKSGMVCLFRLKGFLSLTLYCVILSDPLRMIKDTC